MTNISTRNSVLGIKAETTEGTLIAPSADTDYAKLQDDFSLAPNQETLDNAELTGSIGIAKPVQGLASPSLSFSSYLKHSETEGSAPEAGALYKALFGTETVAGTEYNTVAASTVSVVKVDSGEGVNYVRGQGLLVKDGTNGYSIRPVESVSSDDLTLGFNLSDAPAVGVDLGKCIQYSPADSGHDSLSMHMYWGNGGLHQAIAGARVTSWDLTADAGQLTNGSFSIEGVKLYNNPLTTTSSLIYIDFTETGPLTKACSVAVKSYSDPEELASSIQTAMNAASTADSFTCVYNSTGASAGKFTFTSDGSVFSLLWSTGANTANTIGTLIGFTVGADDTGALTYTSDSAISWAAPHTPSYDNSDALVAKNQEVLFGTAATDITCLNPSSVSVSIGDEKANINDICALSGVSSSLIVGRNTTISFTSLIPQHCVQNFARYRRGDQVRFAYIFGTKSDGSNWDAGYCGILSTFSATITNIEVVDEDGIARAQVELVPYVDAGLGEIYLSFV